MRKGAPDRNRVNNLHTKIYGHSARPGEDGKTINAVQQLVYLEESCQDIVAAIKGIEDAETHETRERLMDELKSTLVFVARFADDRTLLQTLSYKQRKK
jgi:hypothetical protein